MSAVYRGHFHVWEVQHEGMVVLDDAELAQLCTFLPNDKVPAIKALRVMKGLSLRGAKDIIDTLS